MIIPDDVLEKFEQETSNLSFGEVFLSVVRYGKHSHFKIGKQFTIPANENSGDIQHAEEQTG